MHKKCFRLKTSPSTNHVVDRTVTSTESKIPADLLFKRILLEYFSGKRGKKKRLLFNHDGKEKSITFFMWISKQTRLITVCVSFIMKNAMHWTLYTYWMSTVVSDAFLIFDNGVANLRQTEIIFISHFYLNS